MYNFTARFCRKGNIDDQSRFETESAPLLCSHPDQEAACNILGGSLRETVVFSELPCLVSFAKRG